MDVSCNYLRKILTIFLLSLTCILFSCHDKNKEPSRETINAINLKRGELISCGPSENQFGKVDFDNTCDEKVINDFNLGIELLHSFEYDEAEKVFAKMIDTEPGYAMDYWGVAMCNYHPLWTPPTESELKKGAISIEIAQSIGRKSKRETDYIHAISMFYKDWNKLDHHTRSIFFEKEMGKLFTDYPDDKEAAIFYALALDASADPADQAYKNQIKAGKILNDLYPKESNHPGIAHYIIHPYDYPGLASLALDVARKYAEIAPSSAHAQHMPSHIFTRLGLWDESISANLVSVSEANCYAESAGLKGHWDEELHGLDYLVYAYLQKGEDDSAKKLWDYLQTIHEVNTINFKTAYAFAAIPSRYLLENRNWKEAAGLQLYPKDFPWKKFQWQEAIVHFTHLMGSVHKRNLESATIELNKLNLIYDTLLLQKDQYKANQVKIQINTSLAWILFRKGKSDSASKFIYLAADMEDRTEKHPITPCEVIPARELLGDLLLEMNKPGEALTSYEEDLNRHPNRFNGLLGAGQTAQKTGNWEKAVNYYHQLLKKVDFRNSDRTILSEINSYLQLR